MLSLEFSFKLLKTFEYERILCFHFLMLRTAYDEISVFLGLFKTFRVDRWIEIWRDGSFEGISIENFLERGSWWFELIWVRVGTIVSSISDAYDVLRLFTRIISCQICSSRSLTLCCSHLLLRSLVQNREESFVGVLFMKYLSLIMWFFFSSRIFSIDFSFYKTVYFHLNVSSSNEKIKCWKLSNKYFLFCLNSFFFTHYVFFSRVISFNLPALVFNCIIFINL